MTEQQKKIEDIKARRDFNMVSGKKPRMLLKRYFWAYSVVVLIIASFLSGIYIEKQRNLLKAKSDIFGNLEEHASKVESFLGQNDNGGNEGDSIDFDLFWEVWEIVKENYVDQPVDDEKLFRGSLAGIVASLGDRYSIYLPPKETKKFTDDLSGSFEGIGAEIGIKDGQLTVISPLEGSPAEKAGLLAGDMIVKVDDKETDGLSIDEAVDVIRGEKDSEVVLNIYRDGADDPFDVKVVRGTIKIESVKWKMLGDDGKEDNNGKIAYLEITHFNGDTVKKFNDAIKQIIYKDPKALIVDLRNNPGGFLDGAISIASAWVEDGVVVSEKLKGDNKIDHYSEGRAILQGMRTVVLVNQGSASASEIVSGALQDYGLATIIGKQTFGKGSVQDLKSLKDGSSVKITIAKWLTPDGKSIDDNGITPDIEAELSREDYDNGRDPQLDRAVKFIVAGE